jgi:hypothetical protein
MEGEVKAMAFSKFMKWVIKNYALGNSEILQNRKEIDKVIREAKEEAKSYYDEEEDL